MKRCFVVESDSNTSCSCADSTPHEFTPCIPQFGGQSGSQFASGVVSQVGGYLDNSGLALAFSASVGVAIVLKFLRN